MPPSVLIVDDEPCLREMFSAMLDHLGFKVVTAQNGAEGFAKCKQGRYDLILTDILMPVMDGNTMARRIRQMAHPAPPMFAMSGTPWDVNPVYFDGVLYKPFAFEDLNDLIHQALWLKGGISNTELSGSASFQARRSGLLASH